MNITLHKNIEATIDKNYCVFHLKKRKKTNYLRVQIAEIQTAFVSRRRLFSRTLFLIFLGVGLLGGAAHYLYDTVLLGYNPNPLLISIITLGITFIGLILSFRMTPVLRLKFRIPGSKTLNFPLYRYIPKAELSSFLKAFNLEYANDIIMDYLLESYSERTMVYQNSGKIIGGRIRHILQMKWTMVPIFVLVGILGGVGHYLYDTILLEYNPNPTIIGSIVGGVTVIGLIVSFRRRLVLDILPDPKISKHRIRFYLRKDLTDEECDELLHLISQQKETSEDVFDSTMKALAFVKEQEEQRKNAVIDDQVLNDKINVIVEQTITKTLVTLVEETVKKEIKKTATTTPPKSAEVQELSKEFFQDVPQELEKIISDTIIPVAPIRKKRQDYGKMSLTELKAIAKSKGIKGYYKLKKKELISALRNL